MSAAGLSPAPQYVRKGRCETVGGSGCLYCPAVVSYRRAADPAVFHVRRPGVRPHRQNRRRFPRFCTPEGLSRFDGYRFKNFGVAEGLPNRSVNTLLETRSGDYLAGTNGGLCQLRPGGGGRFTTHPPGKQFENYGNALIEDSTGRIWCGTAIGLFEMLSDHTFGRQQLPAPVRGKEWVAVSDIPEDAGGKLWTGDSHRHLRYREGWLRRAH
jgi:ligand-binding sensor domain-containing protein